MSIIQNPDSFEARELAKWNAPKPYSELPAACYLATRPPTGGEPEFEMVVAESQNEIANLRSRGYGVGQAEAVQFLEEREFKLAEGAAHRAFTDRRLSEPARREAAAVEASTDQHVAEIPSTPVRRGRPRKTS